MIGATVFAGTYPNIYRSDDWGVTWMPIAGSPWLWNGQMVVNDRTILAASNDGLSISQDAGATWVSTQVGLPSGRGLVSIAASWTPSARLYGGVNSGGVWFYPVSGGL